ncbi:MAG: pyrroline-5-carboxylate reductase [Agarilytica sp.]
MASAIIGGLIEQGFDAQQLSASAPVVAELTKLQSQYGIRVSESNLEPVAQADVVVLAVKPQIMQRVCEEIASTLRDNTLVVSIAAGVTCENLDQWLNGNRALVRCMPNTPASVGLGASGLFANKKVSAEQKAQAENIISTIGIARWVATENLIDAVTAVSGSSPAYFFLFLESMVDAATQQGMDKTTATELAIQSAIGAATLAQQSEDDLVTLRKKVTSPKGTTEQAIKVFEEQNLRGTVAKAMTACIARAKELAGS